MDLSFVIVVYSQFKMINIGTWSCDINSSTFKLKPMKNKKILIHKISYKDETVYEVLCLTWFDFNRILS